MSSLKLGETETGTGPTTDVWIPIRSPLAERGMPQPTGVVLEIAKLRERFSQRPDGTTIFVDEDDYGSGDSELADDIAEYVDDRWDT
jgi:hypothetical protein